MQKFRILGTAFVCGLMASFAIVPLQTSAHAVSKPGKPQLIVSGNLAFATPGYQNISWATCPSGYVVSGGGYQLFPSFYPLANFFISQNSAVDKKRWRVTLFNSSANGSNTIKFKAQAICLPSA